MEILGDVVASDNNCQFSAADGDTVRVLHIGSGHIDKGWVYVGHTERSDSQGWVHVSNLESFKPRHVPTDRANGNQATYRHASTLDTGNTFQHLGISLQLGPHCFERKGIGTQRALAEWAQALSLSPAPAANSSELLVSGKIGDIAVSATITLNPPMDQEVGSLDLPSLAAVREFAKIEPEYQNRMTFLDLCFTIADPWVSRSNELV